ncbi:hypothetical protein ACPPVU_08705 [Mucilaginibacter sp. McL0603]|uniref:hypothetical protein n=1 Tax=Mucilaginibacter sp. McL0603 TaxID=3415670 RepID=UPI003CFA56EA
MEVHHHPEVEKKGFKEYLLEGLMIFLAVLMGFIAENIRENISEHKRAAEFAHLYYGDIKKDTAQLQAAMRFNRHKIAAIDSVIPLMHQPESAYSDTILMLKGRVSSIVLPFQPSSGNYEQLKSSGAIKEFKPKMVALMNEYDLQVKQVVRREDISQQFITQQLMPFIIDHGNMENSYDIMTTGKIQHGSYMGWTPEFKKKYLNMIVFIKILSVRSMQEYEHLLLESNKVLKELKKEYDIEED